MFGWWKEAGGLVETPQMHREYMQSPGRKIPGRIQTRNPLAV